MNAGARRNYARDGIDIYIWEYGPLSNVSILGEIALREVVEKDEFVLKPAITLRMEAAQNLIDELWNAGLRPKYAQATDATDAARLAHIGDLRMVVERLLTPQG